MDTSLRNLHGTAAMLVFSTVELLELIFLHLLDGDRYLEGIVSIIRLDRTCKYFRDFPLNSIQIRRALFLDYDPTPSARYTLHANEQRPSPDEFLTVRTLFPGNPYIAVTDIRYNPLLHALILGDLLPGPRALTSYGPAAPRLAPVSRLASPRPVWPRTLLALTDTTHPDAVPADTIDAALAQLYRVFPTAGGSVATARRHWRQLALQSPSVDFLARMFVTDPPVEQLLLHKSRNGIDAKMVEAEGGVRVAHFWAYMAVVAGFRAYERRQSGGSRDMEFRRDQLATQILLVCRKGKMDVVVGVHPVQPADLENWGVAWIVPWLRELRLLGISPWWW